MSRCGEITREEMTGTLNNMACEQIIWRDDTALVTMQPVLEAFAAMLFDDSFSRTIEETRCVLQAVSATSLHAYWEIDPLEKELIARHFCSDWNTLPFVIRISDVTDRFYDGTNAWSTKVFPIHFETDNWYFHELHPGRNYVADLCTFAFSGEYFTIIRSNTVWTPQTSQNAAEILHFSPTRLTTKYDNLWF